MGTDHSDPIADDKLHVFLSYARPDQASAETVEAFLTAAGVRVFRDDSDIRVGDNWDLSIERALGECQRMVLLLSSASMPDRKEVHREWLYFDQKRKPIYPLLLEDCTLHSRFTGINYIDARAGLPSALDRLLAELTRGIDLPAVAATASPAVDALTEFRDERIAEWSLPRYTLDKRFVNLTLLLDRGESEQQRWQRAEEFRFNDLRDVMARTEEHPALALLGAPGSGKSTLLRRLELDHSRDRLSDGGDGLSFFIQLNGYRAEQGELPAPRAWLAGHWKALFPRLPSLESLLQAGRMLLLLDAINEMPHRGDEDYRHLVGRWREFTQEAAARGNRILFSCRSLDYSASLSGKELRVPQVEVQPMRAEQMREFLVAYSPAHEARVWRELEGKPQFEVFQTPYFLKLLCEQVNETGGDVPRGRASLFTGYVRGALQREMNEALLQPGALLDERDHHKLSRNAWRDAFDLPERGALLPKLSDLAFAMQQSGMDAEGAQVRIEYDKALGLLAHERAEDILKAGLALNVLDESRDEIAFFHQLLQEYFAARRLAKQPAPALVRVEWMADRVSPTLDETLAGLADGDPLPPLPQTGWEETTLTAAPMAKDPAGFIRDLIPHNLALAARCAASPETNAGPEFRRQIQTLLIVRTQDMNLDLRARIAAGEALGTIGDPRFELRTGPHGDYLAPPLVEIPGGTYPMGDDKGNYDDEKPACKVTLDPFQIGRFPITNAEYAKFMAADGYDDPQWWDTEESQAWLRGEGGEGAKEGQRDFRKTLQGLSEDSIRDMVKQNRITSQQADDWITIRNWAEEPFEQWLDGLYPSGETYRQPKFWDDARFNNPSQPVVGVTWFEARAYCNWLTANENGDVIYRLPTEAEFEAAARGKKGRAFPYGKGFDATRCNTFESHIRRTTPVGIFDNATPEGALDLSGNAYTWTSSIHDQQRFPYPYRNDDGREDIHATNVRRVLRGGSWFVNLDSARSVCRYFNRPAYRDIYIGCRVVCVVRPPSN